MLIVGRLSWKTRKPRKGGPSEAFKVVEIGSCAGAIEELDHVFSEPLVFAMVA